MKSGAIANIAVLFSLTACADQAPVAMRKVELTYDKLCGAVIDGQKLGPVGSADFDAGLQALIPDKNSLVSFGQPDVPRSCIEQMVAALGRLGYRGKVGFISEPPGSGVSR